jgi:hypothetical protein
MPVVAMEIVGFQEQEDAAAGLVADRDIAPRRTPLADKLTEASSPNPC